MDRYFDGTRLFGDDFTHQEIEQWFADEKDGYAELVKGRESYEYNYHGLNTLHGYSRIDPQRRFTTALGFGSAYGDELIPVLDRIDSVYLLDSSEEFHREHLERKVVNRVAARMSGDIDLPDSSMQLITCLGVLHHIPNVSHVLAELARVLSDDGYLIIREPSTSMGDWRKPRGGLTKRERGIPPNWMRERFISLQLETVYESPCVFPITARLGNLIGQPGWQSLGVCLLDKAICRLATFNWRYHATTKLQKLRPGASYYVLRKGAGRAA